MGRANSSSSSVMGDPAGASPFITALSETGVGPAPGTSPAAPLVTEEKEDTAISLPFGERVWDWLPALVKVLAGEGGQ